MVRHISPGSGVAMITVKDLVDILTEEVSKNPDVMNYGVYIDDRNSKVRFTIPHKAAERTSTKTSEQGFYDHWKEVGH